MSQLFTRRRFLEDSLLGMTAAIGAAYAGASTAVAQAPAVPTAANDKIGVAIVGCGGRGGSHIGFYRGNNRCTILYLVDPDFNRINDKVIDQIAESQGGIKPQIVADMRKAYEDKAVNVVSSATCNHWHALSALWAVQAGKHVYVEKPGNHNLHEGLALEAAAKKYKRVVQIGTQARSNKANIDAVKFVRDGGIGEVKFGRGLCYKRRAAIGPKGEYTVPARVDYDAWSGPAPLVPLTRQRFDYDWHWQRLYGNGDLGNQGSHQTDATRWYLGLDRLPDAVISFGGRLGYDIEKKDPNYVDAGDVANTEVTIYDYGDKCMVFETRGLETPALNIPNGNVGAKIGAIIYGSKGYLVHTDNYGTAVAYNLDGSVLQRFTGGGDHFGNFLNAVVANDPSATNTNASCGLYSAAVSHFGNISYYLGESKKASASEIKSALKAIKSLDNNDETVDRTIEHLKANKVDLDRTPMSVGPLLKFDQATKKFVGNDAANAMLTRQYRAPYIVPKPEDV